MKRHYILLGLLVVLAVGVTLSAQVVSVTKPVIRQFQFAKRLHEIGNPARARLRPGFDRAHMTYPPQRVTLVGFKQERVLQVYAAGAQGEWRFITAYPILAASGLAGPKLQEGDAQVPEGIYVVESLNPNSAFHVALRVNYPNAFDREHAKAEGRVHLGGDIMIHGGAASIGCLAMGDPAAEDLFVLAADTGVSNLTVVLAPVDFRMGVPVAKTVKLPEWTELLYNQIRQRLTELPVPSTK